MKGFFYCVGGRNNLLDGNMDFNVLDVFDFIRNIWFFRSSMIVLRNCVGIGVIDNMIYVVGGL